MGSNPFLGTNPQRANVEVKTDVRLTNLRSYLGSSVGRTVGSRQARGEFESRARYMFASYNGSTLDS